MIAPLCGDAIARGDIALCLPGLLVHSVLSSLWGTSGGGISERGSRGITHEVIPPQQRHQSPSTPGQAHQSPSTPGQALPPTTPPTSPTTPIVLELGSTPRGVEDKARLAVIAAQHDFARAVKADDAEVPVHIWDNRVVRGNTTAREAAALVHLRDFALRVYR